MIRSNDGTMLAFDKIGSGPPIVLVSGASCDRGVHVQLAELLAHEFTVVNYDRRGRGESGNVQPYAVEREIEDLAAMIVEAGGPAAVFGNSSGGVLAMHAAAAGLPITKLALWEVPFGLDPDTPRRQKAYSVALNEYLAEGRNGDAMAEFLGLVGMPGEMIAQMRQAPMWPAMEKIAPTLAYDAAIMGDGTLPKSLAASVKIPTLVLSGDTPFLAAAARALGEALPEPHLKTLEGQSHNVDFEVLAPAIAEFCR